MSFALAAVQKYSVINLSRSMVTVCRKQTRIVLPCPTYLNYRTGRPSVLEIILEILMRLAEHEQNIHYSVSGRVFLGACDSNIVFVR